MNYTLNDLVYSNGFICKDVHNFEKLKNLSINVFDIYLYKDQSQWKHVLIPIQFSKKFQVNLLT